MFIKKSTFSHFPSSSLSFSFSRALSLAHFAPFGTGFVRIRFFSVAHSIVSLLHTLCLFRLSDFFFFFILLSVLLPKKAYKHTCTNETASEKDREREGVCHQHEHIILYDTYDVRIVHTIHTWFMIHDCIPSMTDRLVVADVFVHTLSTFGVHKIQCLKMTNPRVRTIKIKMNAFNFELIMNRWANNHSRNYIFCLCINRTEKSHHACIQTLICHVHVHCTLYTSTHAHMHTCSLLTVVSAIFFPVLPVLLLYRSVFTYAYVSCL